MSVRNAVSRVRPHVPDFKRARGSPSAIGAAGSLLTAAVVAAAVALLTLAGVSHTGVLAAVMAALFLVALALLGWAVPRAARGALRPVERLHEELAGLEGSDLSRRVTVPPTGDDVEGLARRVNVLLARQEEAPELRREFIADASHELRTPITALRTRIELALGDPDGDAADALRQALRDVERLHQIVEDLHVLARLDVGDKPGRERIDIGRLVEAEVGRRSPPVPTTVEADSGLLIEANQARLCRVLLNLLANAERHAVAMIEVAVRAEEGEAVVEVRDDGPGIPPAERERVFERFARLDSARSRADGGSGLGLALSREIAVAHGGRLYVGDGVRGARLVLRIPLADPR